MSTSWLSVTPEPERLLPSLNLESDRIRPLISAFLVPFLQKDHPTMGSEESASAADYVARMLLSWISSGGGWDLTDRGQVRRLVRTELLAGGVLQM